MKGVIGVLQQCQGSAIPQLLDQWLEEAQVRKRIVRALQEQHGNLHIEEVLGARLRGARGWMQRECEEREPSHVGKRYRRLRLGSHPAAEGSSPCHERQARRTPGAKPPRQKRAYVLADNQLAITGSGWDPELLRLELGELKLTGFDLSLTGFGDLELKDLLVERTAA